MPDFPENIFPIAAPLVIPEAQLLDVLSGQELISCGVVLVLSGQPVFKAVQFHRQTGRGTIEVEEVSADWKLAPEFEPRKAARPQGLPELRLSGERELPRSHGGSVEVHPARRAYETFRC